MDRATLDPVDDWADVTSPALRRVLQNRLNQRASRQRKRNHELRLGLVRRGRGRPKSQTALQDDISTSEPQGQLLATSCKRHGDHVSDALPGVPRTDTFTDMIRSLAKRVLENLCVQDPSADVVLLPLTRLNSLRGILANMYTLDIQLPEMEDDTSISSFNKAWDRSSKRARTLPSSLQPTEYQISHPHHPWFDILPFPKLRETLIARQDEYDDTELCIDMLGMNEATSVGLLVWRDPWDPAAWEMTEQFVKKWGWLFKSSLELRSSTTQWRSLRGEDAIVELLDS
ncbi:hypothetical protein VHEMI09848 [[Torrubiella] hemipterigena]|uniref:BZIP domain-containing protein n=1 Tax=[Torrubiella] hemipterigena TaxID=1531966 RepID=A0A0A1TR33_9HYPO|nr:hypothetical protein VHEMI09848 [[Torrubiella] hemipterigena]